MWPTSRWGTTRLVWVWPVRTVRRRIASEPGGAAVDDEPSGSTEAQRLAKWWETLSNLQRREAYSLGQVTPMPEWMVTSLHLAGVSGLVEVQSDPPDFLPPWFAMPHAVAEFVARRRRIDATV